MRLSAAILILSLTGCIHAQSTATGASSTTGTSISGSSGGAGAVCVITTTSVPPGTVGVVYTPATLTTSGCIAPLTWSITVGSLPTGLSLNASTGVISGTPSVAGTSSPTFHVVDTNGKSDIFDTPLSIAAAPSGATPVLPDSTLLTWDTSVAGTPSPVVGPITVGDGSGGPCALTGGTCSYPAASWATAWAAAGCGQTVITTNSVLTLAGNLTLNKVCDQAHYITIERDITDTIFPAEGTRVTPCYSGIPSSALTGMPFYQCISPQRDMPYIQKTSGGATINIFGTSYRFVGIEWGRNNSYDLDFGIINMAISSCTAPDLSCMNSQPTFNIFDRNIIHGDAQRQTAKAIALGGTRWVAVLDSYVYDISETYLGGGGDANPFGWGNGKNFTNSGFGKFHNNFVEASTMGNLFCGAFTEPVSPSTGFDGIPHDVWLKQNWYFKKILWDTQLGQTQGTPQTVEGVTYAPAADQEFIQLPSAIQLAANQTYQVQTWTGNDSNGGINRSQAGTNSLTGCGTNCGSVATQFLTVGSGIHQSISQFITTFTAPPSPGSVTYTRCWPTSDARTATIGANRNMCASTVFTIVVPAAATAGPSFPTLGGDGGGGVTWATPSNVTANDGTYSTASAANLQVTNVLKASGYGFSIPTTATINGIQVDVQEKEFNPSGASQDNSAKLMKVGAAVGSNLSTGSALLNAGSVHTFGGSGNLWGTTWTPADINNSGFGFAFQAIGEAATSNGPGVDYAQITVFYTGPGPTHQMVVGPAASDLKIQPSYSDAFGNSRQFSLQFNAIPNFTSASTTWDVDGVVGGNSTVGTIDSTGLYTSPATTGSHTIHATASDSTVGSSSITVSSTAPIVGFDGRPNAEKNGWELKCGRKILHENFLIENAWGSNGNGSGQGGQAFLVHPFNQNGCSGSGANCNTSILSGAVNVGYGPFEIADVTVRNGKAMRMGAGFVVGGSNNTIGIRRVAISNILCDDCSYKHNSHGFNLVTYYSTQFNGGGSTVYSWESASNPMSRDISYSHITDIGDVPVNNGIKGGAFGIAQNSLQPLSINYVMQDSIFAATGGETFYDPQGAPPGQSSCNGNGGLGVNNTELKVLPCFAAVGGLTLSHIALLDSTTAITPGANWPDAATLWTPASSDAALFRNYNAGDYRVVSGGLYDAGGARQASDSTALGADVTALSAIEQNIRNGVITGLPFSISTSSLPSAIHNVAYSQTLAVSGGVAPYTWSTPADITPSGATDTLDYAEMPISTRSTSHLSAPGLYKAYYQNAGMFFWEKNSQGYPSDIEAFDANYISQWGTEMDSSQDAACIANGWPSCFSDPQAYKLYINAVHLWKRYHVPGADDVVYTPGPNKYNLTTNCGADNQTAIDNLGVRGELTGPFNDVTWTTTYGGNIPDNTPYLLAQKWIKCTANDVTQCTDRETYWLVQGYGQARWCPASWNGSTYVTGTCTTQTTVSAGGAPTPNFACTLPNPAGLPNGTLKANGAPMALGDSTGTISGTFNVGTYTFTIQVEDAVGHIATKAFTLTVN